MNFEIYTIFIIYNSNDNTPAPRALERRPPWPESRVLDGSRHHGWRPRDVWNIDMPVKRFERAESSPNVAAILGADDQSHRYPRFRMDIAKASDLSSYGSHVQARHKQIIDIARRTGRVTVDKLAEELSVTPQTIRKDLNELCDRSLLSRVHGGAVITSGVDNVEYEARRMLAREEKQAIGAAASVLIPNHASLFINIGTTTEEVARALIKHTGLLVITNNLNVVDILYRSPSIEVIVVGGRIRAVDRATVGSFAVEFIRNFKVDFAIVGASAIDEDGSLLDFDMNEVQVSQTIIEYSRQVILVADSHKLGRSAPVRIGHVSDIDIYVTDRLNSPRLAAVCETNSVKVVETSRPKK